VSLITRGAAILLLSLVSCATPYQQNGLLGGVEVTPLQPDTYRINARGNGFSSAARMQDFILLKAAELARGNHFTHFVILSENDWHKTETMVSPGYITGNTMATVVSSGNLATGTATTQAIYMPPTSTTVSKPRSDAIVRLLNNPPANANAFDANFIYQNLAPKYVKQ
jgi:hypothetical protein